MSLANVKQFHRTDFSVSRFTDRQIVESLESLLAEAGQKVSKSTWHFTFADQSAEFAGETYRDGQLEPILELASVSTHRITFDLNGGFQIAIQRGWDNQRKALTGNQDTLSVSPLQPNQQHGDVLPFAKLIALARKHFDAVDTKPFLDFLDEGTKQLYESREQDIQKLERMQESFFESMTQFTLDQQQKQQEFQRQLEAEYATRQSRLEEQHQERLQQFEAKEAELKRIRDDIDERENRQARRDIYKELKGKLDERNKTFELTEGTRNRRRFTFWFTIALLAMFATGFGFCFYKNVLGDPTPINWVAVGSQIGFAIAFVGVATFFIRWNHQWFQRHADEEFKLKRLDLDIDRANWLVELAMEWNNIMKSDIPHELIDKLARSLFVTEETQDIDIHPAETLLTAIFGKAGSINVEFPGKLTVNRSDQTDRKS